MTGRPFYTDHVGPACIRTHGEAGAARELASRVELQLLQVIEGWKDHDGWQVHVRLELERPPAAELPE